MIDRLSKDGHHTMSAPDTPHLSHSRINRYLHCPEQYRLYYIEGLRPRFPAASLIFGQIVHQALAQFFSAQTNPVESFLERWNAVKDSRLTYRERESWEKLQVAGQVLLEKFLREEVPRFNKIEGGEKPFELDITDLDLPFVGIIDLVAALDGKRTVVDFKTSGSTYDAHEARLSDQLTAYQLAEPGAEQVALCVLIKTKTPRIEWLITDRSADEVVEYLAKARFVANEIKQGHFYKRPGKWCAWCDYLSVCVGDTEKTRGTLVKRLEL